MTAPKQALRVRKKPVEVQALQWLGTNWDAMNAFMDRKLWWLKDGSLVNNVNPLQPLIIQTLEGNHEVQIGDWVIKGVNGEFYPCKPGIFDKTYEILSAPDESEGEK